MADVRLTIARREYIVTCRDGEEQRLMSLGAIVDEFAKEAGESAGGLNESRQLLFASLLLADRLHEMQSCAPARALQDADPVQADPDLLQTDRAAAAIEQLAGRIEAFVNRLEN